MVATTAAAGEQTPPQAAPPAPRDNASGAPRHIVALDVLRGIAALVVVIGHCTLVYRWPNAVVATFSALFEQRAAVLIFFVLSGYVLALSWTRNRGRPAALRDFYIRRAFRLLPALWVATALALVLLVAFPFEPSARFSDWMAASYRQPTAFLAVRSILALDDATILPPNWTIVIEMLGSLALPGIVAVMCWGRGVSAAFVLVAGVIFLALAEWYSRFQAVVFVLQFAIGCALALYPPRLARRHVPALLAFGAALLMVSRPLWWMLVTGEAQPIVYRTEAAVPALFETLGAALTVAGLVAEPRLSNIPRGSPLRRLGDWSYGIYLVHFPVMRIVARSLPPMPQWQALLILTALTVVITIVLAGLIYRFVEVPGIALGKRFTGPGLAPARAEP